MVRFVLDMWTSIVTAAESCNQLRDFVSFVLIGWMASASDRESSRVDPKKRQLRRVGSTATFGGSTFSSAMVLRTQNEGAAGRGA